MLCTHNGGRHLTRKVTWPFLAWNVQHRHYIIIPTGTPGQKKPSHTDKRKLDCRLSSFPLLNIWMWCSNYSFVSQIKAVFNMFWICLYATPACTHAHTFSYLFSFGCWGTRRLLMFWRGGQGTLSHLMTNSLIQANRFRGLFKASLNNSFLFTQTSPPIISGLNFIISLKRIMFPSLCTRWKS